MNSIRVKSGSFEIEIQTDQPQTPKQMAEAIVDVVKAAPPPKMSQVIDETNAQALPALVIHESDPGSVSKRRKRRVGPEKRGQEVVKSPTAEDKVEGLISDGKFEKPQGLRDVHLMLERLALPYSIPHTANALASLVRKQKLERIG